MCYSRRDGKAMKQCKRCGRCCSYEIPVTLLDLERIAAHTGEPAAAVFARLIQAEPSTAGVFKMAKKADGACVLLDADRRCGIHPARPSACRLYRCDDNGRTMDLSTCPGDGSELMWEQSVAMMITRAYVRNNGCEWNEVDYGRALASIRGSIRTAPTQTLRLARDGQGHPLAVLYDCSACPTPGECAHETVVTLDDLRRIARHLRVEPGEVFGYVSSEPGETSGSLVLRRDRHCVFRGGDGRCSIEAVKPAHCRFTVCPRKVQAPAGTNPLYFGEGGLRDQFRHHVALGLTREYVRHCGVTYHRKTMKDLLRRLDEAVADPVRLAEFAGTVERYRYVAEGLKI